MPPYRSPKSLYRIVLRNTESLVDFACDKISKCGEFSSPITQEYISELKSYLSNHLPANVLDDLCEERKESSVRVSSTKDVRIKLAVYMHENMVKFSVDTATQESRLPVEDPFWTLQFSLNKKLKYLDLHLLCTDEILEVVGRCCPNLEEVNIISRIESDVNTTLANVVHDAYAAMKLYFFVSDIGLEHLSNCQKLRKVTVNKMMRSRYGGRLMTESGIRNLIKSLPKLEYLSYGDLGSVLAHDMDDVDQLHLIHISDLHPQTNHIITITRLCPYLQHLSLCIPSREVLSQPENASEILQALGNSCLSVTVLELQQFPFNSVMLDMLEKKGNKLTSLLLRTAETLTSKHITILGRLCPYLKNLHLKELGSEVSIVENVSTKFAERWLKCNAGNYTSTDKLFPLLQCLYLSGRGWNPGVVIPLCLTNSSELTNLSLLNTSNQEPIDIALAQILASNALQNLKAVYFFAGCHVSMHILRYFVTRCPVLTQLTFWEHTGLDTEEVRKLQEEVEKSNLELKICYLAVD